MQQSATVESSTRVIELIVHNESSDSEALNSVTNEWLNSFTTQNPVFRILETAKAPGSDFVSSVSNEIYRLEVSEISNELHEVIDHLQREWVKSVSQNSRQDLWLEVPDVGISPEALASSKHTIEISFLSMGCFLSPGVYSRHWNSERSHHSQPRINVSFEYDRHEIDIRYKNIENQTWKFETSFEHVHKLLLVTPCERTCQIYLFLKNPLKLCLAVRQVPSVDSSPSDLLGMPDDGPEEAHYSWVREVRFDDCSREIIGSSSVVCLGIENRGTTGAMNNVIARLRKLGLTVVVGNPRVQDAKEHEQIKVPDFQNFRLTYSWHCLRSRGFKVTDQVTEELVAQLNSLQQEPWLETALEAVIREVDSRIVCTIARQFEEEIEKRRRPGPTGDVHEDVAVPNVVFVRRVIFTPTALKLLAEEWTLENRVIRKFGSDRFIRVSIRDVDFKPLTSTFVSVENITKEIINFLTYGLRIGSRHYRFLGCSNSQLRSHGVWMYASDGTNTVESIRDWMGDLSHEKCVATYVKRLGQCFTTTKDSVKVNRIERIADVKVDGANGGYCFTDGIGRISTTLALKVTKALRLKPSHAPPSAFQIRLGGCKGVVALAPELGEEEALQIRPSMEKYPSEHDELDVADHTKPSEMSESL